MEELSHAGAQLASRASSWAVDAALLIAAGAFGVAVVVGLGGAILGKIRDMMKAGATPGQVATLLDQKINGSLGRIERKLDVLDEKVDGHGERLARLEGRNGWDGRDRRRTQ